MLWEEYGGEGKFNVLVIYYDFIMWDKVFLKKVKWNYMIVDEGNLYFVLDGNFCGWCVSFDSMDIIVGNFFKFLISFLVCL